MKDLTTNSKLNIPVGAHREADNKEVRKRNIQCPYCKATVTQVSSKPGIEKNIKCWNCGGLMKHTE